MLACYPRRQYPHQPFHSAGLPSSSSSSSPSSSSSHHNNLNYFDVLPYTLSSPDVATSFRNQYLNSVYLSQNLNPPIRVQQPTSTPQPLANSYQSSMQFDSGASSQVWQMYEDNDGPTSADVALQTPGLYRRSRSHQRTPSNSTVASSGPASPYGPSTSYPQIANAERSPPSSLKIEYGADESSGAFPKSLPTPSHTPTNDSFLPLGYQLYHPSQHYNTNAHTAMKQFAMDHHTGADETPDFSHSARQSVSSFGQDSPATPRTSNEDYEERTPKVPANGEDRLHTAQNWMAMYSQHDFETDIRDVPKFDRTMSDIYQDELYNPANATSAAPSVQTQAVHNSTLLSPYRNVVNERLQAANNARSHSPANSLSRERSPFRQGSPFANVEGFRPSGQILGTAAGVRQQQKAEADAIALARHLPAPPQNPPKTISPKEAMLDYTETEEDAKMPLFPEGHPEYQQQWNRGSQPQYQDATQNNFDNATEQSYSSRRPSSPNFSTSGNKSNFTFLPPAVPGQMPPNPYASQQYRSATSAPLKREQTPEFPAHLTSMESSVSDAGAAPSSSQGSSNDTAFQRPVGTSADTGTYTCTYHGCTLRFESPAKLQKHKREGHRQPARESVGRTSVSPDSPGSAGMTSSSLLQRNSQAGPHKCERINPSTGKPCNTIFSRPYDLTRHEDTIHNARKQKVRCALCIEEKTFSRNDALTRHMRVVHPEVDFPGKRGRGRHE
ncbi:hypothetical protein BJ546DRAFT_1028195 [Cryomyces antarcticus]